MSERWIHDPVPKNVSKFPIHQTYLATDSERTAKGGYKFKCPEVWDSARSGKKSIAFRSAEWLSRDIALDFSIYIHDTADGSTHTNDIKTGVGGNIAAYDTMADAIKNISNFLTNWLKTENPNILLNIAYQNNVFSIEALHPTGSTTYTIKITKDDKDDNNVNSWDRLFNQPYSGDIDFTDKIELKNVWDRKTVNFHASFIPFDNYQYLGKLNDKWDKPVIYQDPNSSPLFNIWTTTDLKNVLPILYEDFVFRFTFIISSDSHYNA